MKRLPFNACDYRCERCLETAECEVYLDGQERALDRRLGNRDGEDDLSAVLDNVKESFREAEEMIRAGAEKFGIDIDDIPTDVFDEVERRYDASRNDTLFCRASDFTQQTREFLKMIDPLVDGASRAFYDDIDWHHSVVSAKVFRAVGADGNEYRDEDARNSAAVAVKSLTICTMIFDELASRFPDISEACTKLGSMASALKIDIRLRWLTGR
jgi:hypothetical protein